MVAGAEPVSLRIQTSKVARVLLTDGWHVVTPETFIVDSYTYVEPGGMRVPLDTAELAGFQFQELGREAWLCGPLTSVLAVEEQ